MSQTDPLLRQSECAACGGARVEVVLGSVIPCGRCGGSGDEPRRVLEQVVAANDHLPDGTAFARMQAAIDAARKVLDA